MARLVALILCLTIAGLIAWNASGTPEPKPLSATGFSADAAMTDVRVIAARPHPIGSAEHDRVRDYIAERFRRLGLDVAVTEGQAYDARPYAGEQHLEGGRVQNVVAVLRGRNPALPALAILAHYDTVPASPGAADDTVGVAAALEIARVMKSGAQSERDVMFVITDGEEAGLLGARAFFADDPAARRVGAVLNMESRGGGGRAYMFETGAGDGEMIELFQRATSNRTASSLSGFVYSHMPNDTDFTVPKAKGLPGLNFAFIGRPFDYHAASSTAANLDQGSLQHVGDQVLVSARALADAPRLPARTQDVVYSDLLGGLLIVYPAWVGWIVLAAAVLVGALALSLNFKREPFRLSDGLRGVGFLVLAAVFAAGLTALVRYGTGVGAGFTDGKALMARFGFYEAALAAACLCALAFAAFIAGLGSSRFWGVFAGVFAVLAVMAGAMQALAPMTAFLLAWPLLAAAVLALAAALRWQGDWAASSWVIFAGVIAALAMGQILYVAHPVILGIGLDLPEVVTLIVLMALPVLAPLLWPAADDQHQLPLAVVALAITVGLTLWLRATDPWSARHPRPTAIVYVADAKGAQWRASLGRTLLPWTRTAIAPDNQKIGRIPLAPLQDSAWGAPAGGAQPAEPAPTLVRGPDGRVSFKAAPSPGVRQILIDLKTTGAAGAPSINGRPVKDWSGPGRWTHIIWNAPTTGLEVSFQAPSGAVEARWAEIIDGWPAAPLPQRPAGLMPFMDSDSLVLMGAATLP
jgi:hypothetical protein